MKKIIKGLIFISLSILIMIIPISVQADNLTVRSVYEDGTTYYTINGEGKYTYTELRCELLLRGESLYALNFFAGDEYADCEPVGYYEDGTPYYTQKEYDIYIQQQEQQKQEAINKEKEFLSNSGYTYVTREEAARIIEDCKTNPCPIDYKIYYDGEPMEDSNTNKELQNNIHSSPTYVKAVWTHSIQNIQRQYFSTCDIHISALNKMNITKTQYNTALKMINDVADKNNYGSDFEKIKRIAEWEMSEFTYDDNAVYSADIYNTMMNKRTVCVGYAGIFQLCMERMGIESYMLGIPNHALNVVKLDGKYYFVDVTWMDGKTTDKKGWEKFYELYLLYGRDLSDIECSLPIGENRYDMSFYDRYKVDVKSKMRIDGYTVYTESYSASIVNSGNAKPSQPEIPTQETKEQTSTENEIVETVSQTKPIITEAETMEEQTTEKHTNETNEPQTTESETEKETTNIAETTDIENINESLQIEELISTAESVGNTDNPNNNDKENKGLIIGIAAVIGGCLSVGAVAFIIVRRKLNNTNQNSMDE